MVANKELLISRGGEIAVNNKVLKRSACICPTLYVDICPNFRYWHLSDYFSPMLAFVRLCMLSFVRILSSDFVRMGFYRVLTLSEWVFIEF